jgi:nucleoside-diphosphate-sugar epimerase
MKVLIIGAAGMVGRKVTDQIVADGHIGNSAVENLLLHDIAAPVAPAPGAVAVQAVTSDLGASGEAERLIARRPDVIFHLAAVLSGEAESDLEKGYRVNLDNTRALFEAIRAVGDGYKPRVVFTSTIAVFGKPFPDVIGDDFLSAPLTSYGTEKAMVELMLADYSRRGYFDGIGIRLPTICVRPGKPNKAASGFYSNIIREPLNGEEAVLPVPETIRHWFASPRAAVGFVLHAAGLDTALLGDRRSLSLPGLSATVGEQIAALRKIAGEPVAARIRREPDPAILRIIEGWPERFDTARANALGFQAESSFEEIIRIHIEDELGGSFVA